MDIKPKYQLQEAIRALFALAELLCDSPEELENFYQWVKYEMPND